MSADGARFRLAKMRLIRCALFPAEKKGQWGRL